MARPPRYESARRRQHFARLVAAGVRLDRAADEARIDPRRALVLVDSPEFLALLNAIRAGGESWRTDAADAA